MALSVQPITTGTISGVKPISTPNVSVANPAGMQDPNKIVGYIGGRAYNYAGDWVGAPAPQPSTVVQPGNPTTGAPPPVYAPKLDIAAVNAQARSAAENAVNPFYTKQLNDFLTQQSAQKQQQQTQYDTNIKNYQDTLKQQLEANQLTGERTTEDVANKQGVINTAADQNQQDTGTNFEDARLAAARTQAAGGILGTGAGNRQTATAETARNTSESRQEQAFQVQRDQQELFKSRTFEDLAKSGELAKTTEGKQEKQAKFDLDTYIQNAGFNEQAQRNSLEQDRLQRIAQEQQNQSKLLFGKYLAGISNPAQYEAAVRTYGGSFG